MPAFGDPLVLAIDQGSSATKAIALEGHGAIVGAATYPVRHTSPAPGEVEHDPDELWASVVEAIGGCLHGLDPRRVAAVGISNQRETVVAWDRATNAPVGPALSWQDGRTAAHCEQLAPAAATVRTTSGLPLDPMFSATKMRWLLDTYDPSRSRDLCVGTVDAWLLSHFGGGPVTEVGNASRTQLVDVRRGVWDDRLLDIFDIPKQALPDIVSSTGPFPSTRGLGPVPDGVPIAAVLGDSHAALFAHAGWRTGSVKATYGTGSSVMALAEMDAVPTELCLTVAWDLGSGPALALEGNIRSSGSTLAWLARLAGRTAEEIADLAAKSRADGVHLVPAFHGLGAPWWDPTAKAILVGLDLGTDLGNVARAALESIAFQVHDVVDAVAHHVPVTELLTDGGPSANPTLMQLQADTMGCPVRAASQRDLSALGAAHLAGLGAGLWDVDALEAMDRPSTTYQPMESEESRAARVTAWHEAVARSRY